MGDFRSTKYEEVMGAFSTGGTGSYEFQSYYDQITSSSAAGTFTFSNIIFDIAPDIYPAGDIIKIQYDTAEVLTGALTAYNADIETNITQGAFDILFLEGLADNASITLQAPTSAGGALFDIGIDVNPVGSIFNIGVDTAEVLTGTLTVIEAELETLLTQGAIAIELAAFVTENNTLTIQSPGTAGGAVFDMGVDENPAFVGIQFDVDTAETFTSFTFLNIEAETLVTQGNVDLEAMNFVTPNASILLQSQTAAGSAAGMIDIGIDELPTGSILTMAFDTAEVLTGGVNAINIDFETLLTQGDNDCPILNYMSDNSTFLLQSPGLSGNVPLIDWGIDVFPLGRFIDIGVDTAEVLTGAMTVLEVELEANLTQGAFVVEFTDFKTENATILIQSPASTGGTMIDIGVDGFTTGAIFDASFDTDPTLTGDVDLIVADFETTLAQTTYDFDIINFLADGSSFVLTAQGSAGGSMFDIGFDVWPAGALMEVDWDTADVLTANFTMFDFEMETNLTQGTFDIVLANLLTDNVDILLQSPLDTGDIIFDVGVKVQPEGTFIDFAFDAAETLTGAYTGIHLDLDGNLTHGSQAVRGIEIDLIETDHADGPMGLVLQNGGVDRFSLGLNAAVDNQVRLQTHTAGVLRNCDYEFYQIEYDGAACQVNTGNGMFVTETALGAGAATAIATEGYVTFDAQNDLADIVLRVPSTAIDSGVAADWHIGLDCVGQVGNCVAQLRVMDGATTQLVALENLTAPVAGRDIIWMTTPFGDIAGLTGVTNLKLQIVLTAAPGANSADVYGVVLRYPKGIENQA